MMILPMPMSDDDSSNADERNRNKRDASNREIDALPMSDAVKDSRYRQDSKDSRSRQDNRDSRSHQDNRDSGSRQDSRDSSRSDDDSSNADEKNRNKRDAAYRAIDALPMSNAVKDSRSRQDSKDSRSRQDNGDSHSRQDSRDSSRSDDDSSNADEKKRNKRDASYRDLDELPRSDAVKDSRSLQNSKDSRSRQDSGDSSRSDDDSSNADEKNRNKRDAAYRDSYKAANNFPEANAVKGTSSYGGGSVSVGGGTLQGEMTDSADEAKASAPEAAKTVEDSPRADA